MSALPCNSGDAHLSHIGACGGSHHSVVKSPRSTAIADLHDRSAPTCFGRLQCLCRFDLELGDFWIGVSNARKCPDSRVGALS